MPSALAIIGAATLLAVGGAGVAAYDRHQPVSWHAHVLFWSPGFDLSGGPITVANAARDKALAAGAADLRARQACDVASAAQNAAVQALADQAAHAVGQSQKAVSDARSVAESLRQAQGKIAAYQPPPTEDRCKAAFDLIRSQDR